MSRISPAPKLTARAAHSMASNPVGTRPPFTYTSQLDSFLRASIASTIHCAPNRAAPSDNNSGFFTAAELTLILSAPASNKFRISFTSRIPPPTASGMKTVSATRLTNSSVVLRPSCVAEISRKTNSSAPCSSYRRACSTGSPASRKLTKFTPLTTRPSLMSRQGIILFANIFLQWLQVVRLQAASLPCNFIF